MPKKEDRKWNSGWFSENFCCSGTSGLSKLKQLPRISATVLEIPVPWRGLELFLRIQGFGRGGSNQGQSRGELRAEQCSSPESFIPQLFWDQVAGIFPVAASLLLDIPVPAPNPAMVIPADPAHGNSPQCSCSWRNDLWLDGEIPSWKFRNCSY